MRYPSRLFVLVVCLFACLALTFPTWAQSGSPFVYFSTGATSPSVIYGLNTSTGAYAPLVSTSTANADWQSLVVGPTAGSDYQPVATVPAQAFLIYACDPVRNVIVRFDPNAANPSAGLETVYSGGASLTQPVCGRFTDSGDLVVSSGASGSGLWKFASLATLPLGCSTAKTCQLPAPTQVDCTTKKPCALAIGNSAGIATKTTGDELVADATNGQIWRFSYPINSFSALSSFTLASTVPSATGIARNSVGQVFVSTQGRTPTITQLDSQGNFVGTCAALPNGNWTPNFLQVSLDDTLYAALSANNKGQILAITSTSCNSSPQTFALSVPAVGLALPPTTKGVSATVPNDGLTYSFVLGYNAEFQLTTAGCSTTPSAIAEEVSPGAIKTLINSIQPFTDPNTGQSFFGADPAPDFWADGFEIGFNLSAPGCSPPDNSGFGELLAVQVDNMLASNPLVLGCDFNSTSCVVVQSFGDYPRGGLLPQDGTYNGKDGTSIHFLVNASQSTTEQGRFCGFQSPLLQTDSTTGFASGIAGPFGTGQNLAVKFKLANVTQSGTCKNGPYISDAVALVSVAQIQPAFQIINLDSSGNSTPIMQPNPLTIKGDSNNQYQLSLSLKNYTAGLYTLTITFLTSNTIQQTVEFQVQ